ncbi:MAG: hypothetical protein ABF876_18855 [Acetobacter aceti]
MFTPLPGKWKSLSPRRLWVRARTLHLRPIGNRRAVAGAAYGASTGGRENARAGHDQTAATGKSQGRA